MPGRIGVEGTTQVREVLIAVWPLVEATDYCGGFRPQKPVCKCGHSSDFACDHCGVGVCGCMECVRMVETDEGPPIHLCLVCTAGRASEARH